MIYGIVCKLSENKEGGHAFPITNGLVTPLNVVPTSFNWKVASGNLLQRKFQHKW